MSKHHIVVGVAGGIAAYKTAGLVSELAKADISTTVVMTDAAKQFVGETTFAALSGNAVASHAFEPQRYPLGAHIELARSAELLVVAPATADVIAKFALGRADDLLSTLYLCYEGPVFVAPAMNCEMWKRPSVQRNVEQIRADGVQLIGPEEGWLSCREMGLGRMVEPETLFQVIQDHLQQTGEK